MCKLEKKFVEFIEKNLKVIVMILAGILGLVIRFSLFKVESPDYRDFLEQWFYEIKGNGGLKGLGISVGNYNFLYQTLIAILTLFPIKCLYSYKILSVIFDMALAFAVWTYVKNIFCEGKNDWRAIFAWALVWFTPTVFLNSAAWSQCDSIYTTFIVLALYYLQKETDYSYQKAFILYGLALSFKLQAVFFLPFLLFYWMKKKEFSLLNFLISPVMLVITGLPCLVMGRPVSQLFTLYKGQVTDYSARLSYSYPGIWQIFYEPADYDVYINYRMAAVILAVAAMAGMMIYWLVTKKELTSKNTLYMAFLLVFTAVMFLPAMHERYDYIYVILGMMIVILNKKTAHLFAGLCLLDLVTYSGYINEYWSHFNMTAVLIMAVANVAIYGGYVGMLNKEME